MKKPVHPTIKSLLAEIEAFRAKSGQDRTNFGRSAMHDGNFISRLERGRQPSLHTIDRVRSYINGKTKAARPHK
jgi:hypothetical protein